MKTAGYWSCRNEIINAHLSTPHKYEPFTELFDVRALDIIRDKYGVDLYRECYADAVHEVMEAATAARFGISEQCAALQRDLLTLPGAVKVEFDLDGFYDHMEQVILLVKFDIPVVNENYYRDLRTLRQGVIDTAARHGLTRTPDTIQNYGEHLYFVFHHDSTWEHPVTEQPD